MFRNKERSVSNPNMQFGRVQTARNTRMNRSMSAPASTKGILKLLTVDDSLHSKYSADPAGSRIRWKNIEIREYARTVGDNPSCSSGPPISIDWEYVECQALPIDKYEESRPGRRTHVEMVLPRCVRQDMLRKEWDVSQSQIASAVRQNIKIKNQRRSTVNNLGKATKVEETMEKVSKKIQLWRRSTTKEAKKLILQSEEAQRRRKEMQLQGYVEDDDCDELSADESPMDDSSSQLEDEEGVIHLEENEPSPMRFQ